MKNGLVGMVCLLIIAFVAGCFIASTNKAGVASVEALRGISTDGQVSSGGVYYDGTDAVVRLVYQVVNASVSNIALPSTIQAFKLVTTNPAPGEIQGQFGPERPFYITANWPTLGFNAYYDGGWRYGVGSINEYGAFQSIDPWSGEMNYYFSSAPGAAGDMFSGMNLVFAMYPDGTIRNMGSVIASNGYLYSGGVEVLTASHDALTQASNNVDLVASTLVDYAMTIQTTNAYNVVRGRMYVDDLANDPVDVEGTITFYANSSRKAYDAYWRARAKVVQTKFSVAPSGGATVLTLTSVANLAQDDLLYLFDAANTKSEFVRITSVNAGLSQVTLEEGTQNAYLINDGASRVVEFGGFTLPGETTYGRFSVGLADSMNMKLWVETRR